MKNIHLLLLILLSQYLILSSASAAELEIELEVPELKVSPYFEPYMAVWLETTKRQPVTTITVWYQNKLKPGPEGDGSKWLKDMRQWWRKLGRKNSKNLDAVSGASKKPGVYTIMWDGKKQNGDLVAHGEYILNFEAAREAGGRSFVRQKITLGSEEKYEIAATDEIGKIRVIVK